MPLGTEIGLDINDIVLDRDPVLPPTERGIAAPTFRLMSIVAKRSPISATAELVVIMVQAVWQTAVTFNPYCRYLQSFADI